MAKLHSTYLAFQIRRGIKATRTSYQLRRHQTQANGGRADQIDQKLVRLKSDCDTSEKADDRTLIET